MRISYDDIRFKVWGMEFVKHLNFKDISTWTALEDYYCKICKEGFKQEELERLLVSPEFKKTQDAADKLGLTLSATTIATISKISSETPDVYLAGFAYMKLVETDGASHFFTVCDMKRYCSQGVLSTDDEAKIGLLQVNIVTELALPGVGN